MQSKLNNFVVGWLLSKIQKGITVEGSFSGNAFSTFLPRAERRLNY